MRRRRVLRVAVLVLLGGAVALAFTLTRAPAVPEAALSTIAQGVKSGEVRAIRATPDGDVATMQDGRQFSFHGDPTASTAQSLARLGVTPAELLRVQYEVAAPGLNWFDLLLTFAPVLLLGVLMLFFLRRLRSPDASGFAFGKSRARVTAGGDTPTTTFQDVAGADEPLQELQEVVEFLKAPEKFTSLGARIPKGVLLVGPPGMGKTLLARAVAGEAGVPFFHLSGSEFVEMFVGVGASRVRDLFAQARRVAPCIVFVDEIDAVGRQRGAGLGGGNDEREQTLNQILVELDGFDGNTNVIIIAATNRPDVLDPALLRPGRFDRVVVVPAPDLRGRTAILGIHARGKPLEKSVGLATIAGLTPGFSGADLANVLNEAAILAARRNYTVIGMGELEEAIERVVSGPERKSHVISPPERHRTAVHESGHAVVAHFTAHHDPVHKVTILPRGMSLGATRFLPTEERMYMTRSQFTGSLAAALAGLAAESLVFGDVSTGGGDDIERATGIARHMVKGWGMSDRLGPVSFGHKQSLAFLGRDIGEQRNYSDRTGEVIDDEIRQFVETGYAEALAILRDKRLLLDQLVQELLRAETLDAAALARLWGDPAVQGTSAVSSEIR